MDRNHRNKLIDLLNIDDLESFIDELTEESFDLGCASKEKEINNSYDQGYDDGYQKGHDDAMDSEAG